MATFGQARTLWMCCRSGKSKILTCAALGLHSNLPGLRDHQREAVAFAEVEAQVVHDRRRALLVFSSKCLLEQYRDSELEPFEARRECQVLAVYSNASLLTELDVCRELLVLRC